jgi:hypothetical protein
MPLVLQLCLMYSATEAPLSLRVMNYDNQAIIKNKLFLLNKQAKNKIGKIKKSQINCHET